MPKSKDLEEYSVRINTTISGLPAQWLTEWKQKGLVKSNSDAIRQSFRCFQESLKKSRVDET